MSFKPYVIGIAGGTCSGKSTAADRISAAFSDSKVIVFNMDKYFKKPTPTTIAPITRREYVEHNHPDSLKLDELYADFDAALAGDYDYVIVEGLFALYLDDIREKCDLKLFVDLKSDARLVRRVRRFMQRGQTFDEITDRYIDTVRFRHDELVEPTRWHADIVLNGTLDSNKGLELIITAIKNH